MGPSPPPGNPAQTPSPRTPAKKFPAICGRTAWSWIKIVSPWRVVRTTKSIRDMGGRLGEWNAWSTRYRSCCRP